MKLLCLDCELSPIVSYIWIVGPQLAMGLKVGAHLEELSDWLGGGPCDSFTLPYYLSALHFLIMEAMQPAPFDGLYCQSYENMNPASH